MFCAGLHHVFTANETSEAVAEPVTADQAATAAASTGDSTATGMETDATPAPSQDTPTGTAMARLPSFGTCPRAGGWVRRLATQTCRSFLSWLPFSLG